MAGALFQPLEAAAQAPQRSRELVVLWRRSLTVASSCVFVMEGSFWLQVGYKVREVGCLQTQVVLGQASWACLTRHSPHLVGLGFFYK